MTATTVALVKGYKAVPCDGEAHSNAHIDNCMRCAPMWGSVVVSEKTGERASKAVARRWASLDAVVSDAVADLRRNAGLFCRDAVSYQDFGARNRELWAAVEARGEVVSIAVARALASRL